MLRGLVVGLAAANVVFFAWSHGWVGDALGVSPLGDREPQRVEAQINPQNLRVLQALASPPVAPTIGASGAALVQTANLVCLEAGPFSATEWNSAEAATRAALPEGSWTATRKERPGVWMVYMGRFSGRDQLRKQTAELKRLNVNFEEVDDSIPGATNLEPGLNFGRHNRLEDAQEAMRRLENQKVRNARIVTLTPPLATVMLRVPRADAEIQTALANLRESLNGKSFVACPRT